MVDVVFELEAERSTRKSTYAYQAERQEAVYGKTSRRPLPALNVRA
jgi:hypothetical protein